MKRLLIILISASLLYSCDKKQEEQDEQYAISASQDEITLNAKQMTNAGIETANLSAMTISSVLKLNGTIDVPPTGMASVSSLTEGYVKSSRLMSGNYVKKGQTLAVVENPELVQIQQDYMLAKSNLGYAQKDYERQKALNFSKASSDKVMQRAQTEAQNQKILMHSLAAKLQSYGINPSGVSPKNIRRTVNVTSPISGYVSAVNVNIGQYVSPSEKMFEIMSTNDIHLALKVFEKDLSKISVGQQVFAYTNENPEKKYPAHIILIGKDFGADKSVVVHCHFAGYDPALIPGTFMNAEIETSSEESLAIPENAVVTWENKQYVFSEIKPRTFKMIPVSIGNSENGHTQILNSGKYKNAKLVTKGAYNLLMALKNVEE